MKIYGMSDVTPGESTRVLGVCDRTLRYWEEQGNNYSNQNSRGKEKIWYHHIYNWDYRLSSFMPESHQPSKRKICSVNVNISNPNILMESFSKKLEEGSITNEKNAYHIGAGKVILKIGGMAIRPCQIGLKKHHIILK